MAIPANYFVPDAVTGISQAQADVHAGQELLTKVRLVFLDVQTAATSGGEPLTAAQLTSLRARYITLRGQLQTWFQALPS